MLDYSLIQMDGGVSFLHSPAHVFTPSFFLQGFQELMNPTEVFACENGTLFFHQDENFFLAFGEIILLPVCVFFVCSFKCEQT